MPIVMDVERRGDRELGGGFRVSGRGVNLWVRVYQTDYGTKARITVSYSDGVNWINTPPLWVDKKICMEISSRLDRISQTLT